MIDRRAIVLLSLSGFVVPASAHSQLRLSRPADGESLAAPPPFVSLQFNEKVQLTAWRFYDGKGRELRFARDRSIEPKEAFHAAAPELPAGDYRIEWRAISADGHPIGGSVRFSVKG